MKVEYKIQNEYNVTVVREISVDCDEKNYLVIYGRHINGGFFSIPNWGVGGELSAWWSEVDSNADRINRVLKNKSAAKQIAMAIAEMES